MGLLALFGGRPTGGQAPAGAPGGDAYVFEFGAAGQVTAVYERERDGRLEREEVERDESYARVGDFVVKTEMDDGRVELTYYADADGDGVWIEIAEVLPGSGLGPADLW